MDFIIFMVGLLVLSLVVVLIFHGKKIRQKNRYTDPRHDRVYHDHTSKRRKR